MTLGQLLWLGNGVRVWQRNANPFEMRPAAGWRLAASRSAKRKPPENTKKRRRSWITALWMWTMVLLLVWTGLLCGYGVVENRHEQELRIMSRRTRQVENRLREREIRHRVALQENEKLHAQLAAQQAMLAQLRVDLERTQPMLLARRR